MQKCTLRCAYGQPRKSTRGHTVSQLLHCTWANNSDDEKPWIPVAGASVHSAEVPAGASRQ